MADMMHMKIVCREYQPASLKKYSLQGVAKMLCALNNRTIGPTFPWLRNEDNPFIGIPYTLIEEIIAELTGPPLFFRFRKVRKEMFQILLCKAMKRIVIDFRVNEEDVLHILKTIEATKSNLTWLEVLFYNEQGDELYWPKIPSALRFLKEFVKSLSQVTYLNVSGVCDDEMLEAIGANCQNLVVLVANSDGITSQGLKCLCMNTEDQSKRCQKLQKITLDVIKNYHCLTEGVEALLISLPDLRVLEWSRRLLGKILVKLYDRASNSPVFQLREISYENPFQHMPSPSLPSVIVRTCPFLTTLEIWRASNLELHQFQYLPSLKRVVLFNLNDLANFESGFGPFLRRMGKNLESLELLGVNEIDYNVISENCPKLKRLECTTSRIFGKVTSSTPIFRNLEFLSLQSRLAPRLHPHDCVQLLSRCINLHSLTLWCEGLNESDIQMILLENPLQHLRCVNISSQTLRINASSSAWKNLFE